MSRKAKANGSTALATVATAFPALQITRAEANSRIKARALELYYAARAQREEHIVAFEAEYGRADRIDHTVLADLQRIQARLAAIAARQQRANGLGGEPKVTRFVEQIGAMVGAVSAYLATSRALELFAPIQQADYVGWNGSGVGPKGQDDALLTGYEIVDDPLGAKNTAPTADEDGEVCLHSAVEPYEDEPTRGACLECGEEFGLRGAPADAYDDGDAAEEEPIIDAPAEVRWSTSHETAGGPGDEPGPRSSLWRSTIAGICAQRISRDVACGAGCTSNGLRSRRRGMRCLPTICASHCGGTHERRRSRWAAEPIQR